MWNGDWGTVVAFSSAYVLVIQQALASLWEFMRLDAPLPNMFWCQLVFSFGTGSGGWEVWDTVGCCYHLVLTCSCATQLAREAAPPPPTPTCKVWERHRLLILTRDGPIIINSLIFTEASHYYNKLLMFMKLYIGCPCCHFVLKYECVYDAFWNVWSF